jgi:hypothetical protein
MTESAESAIGFTHFINNLRNSGFKAIHILSHSMGIRLFLNAFGTQEVCDFIELWNLIEGFFF